MGERGDRARSADLLRAATDDLETLEALSLGGDSSDAVLGFHADQAVEQALRAVLVAHGWAFDASHDVNVLLGAAYSHRVGVPDEVGAVRRLKRWSDELYDERGEAPDLEASIAAARAAVTWATALLG